MEKYCTHITTIGEEALSLLEADMIIIFNNNAPIDLAEISIMHTIEELKQDVLIGDIVNLGGHEYEVLFVGSEANYTLRELGHCTFYFYNGENEYRELPAYIVLKCLEKPIFEIGQNITINSK